VRNDSFFDRRFFARGFGAGPWALFGRDLEQSVAANVRLGTGLSALGLYALRLCHAKQAVIAPEFQLPNGQQAFLRFSAPIR